MPTHVGSRHIISFQWKPWNIATSLDPLSMLIKDSNPQNGYILIFPWGSFGLMRRHSHALHMLNVSTKTFQVSANHTTHRHTCDYYGNNSGMQWITEVMSSLFVAKVCTPWKEFDVQECVCTYNIYKEKCSNLPLCVCNSVCTLNPHNHNDIGTQQCGPSPVTHKDGFWSVVCTLASTVYTHCYRYTSLGTHLFLHIHSNRYLPIPLWSVWQWYYETHMYGIPACTQHSTFPFICTSYASIYCMLELFDQGVTLTKPIPSHRICYSATII